ncbi:MAG: hypothetical protein RDU20_19145, partial [Desulfomonilaceae bacterium]|nr:hypothetical protein [Desulfomonilaceae bacterium]
MPKQRKVIVTGDYCRDTFIYAKKWRKSPIYHLEVSDTSYDCHTITVPGAAGGLMAYLAQIGVFAATPDCDKQFLAPGVGEAATVKRILIHYLKSYADVAESLYILKHYRENNRYVWRLDDERGSLRGGGIGKWAAAGPLDLDAKDTTPIVVMDFDQGWRRNCCNIDRLAAGVKNRPYLIRCSDPLRNEWKEFRHKVIPNKEYRPGLWICLSEDIADGALRQPGLWEDYRDIIVNYFKSVENRLWNDKEGWLHYIVVR